jgi:DNA-binding CsgD family transcriptional regulator
MTPSIEGQKIMTARLLTVAPELAASLSCLPGECANFELPTTEAPRASRHLCRYNQPLRAGYQRLSGNQAVLNPKAAHDKVRPEKHPGADLFWSTLFNALRDGVMVISTSIKPVYLNSKAKELCQTLMHLDRYSPTLPGVISEICYRLLKDRNLDTEPLVVESQTPDGLVIRIRAHWLNFGLAEGIDSDRHYILVFLENRSEIIQEELQIEQKKYELTERETEIWMLLRQEYTYQEIAETLQISLNTVKTHVKNVYAKKRSCQDREKIVVF